MKIQFDIKYRPQIESGEYKVETRDGRPARIICWDVEYYYPQYKIGALIKNDEGEDFFFLTEKGYFCIKESGECDSNNDLFIVTPEEELTEFEEELENFYNHHLQVCTYDNQGTVEDSLHDGASKLLSIAREQFIKDGYVIEKKAFHDAVKKVDPKVMKKVSEEWNAMKEALRIEYERGKADALKNIPRWKRFAPNINDTLSEQRICNELENSVLRVDVGGYCWIISREELNKLPKEDEK